jgi:hypothetical protein
MGTHISDMAVTASPVIENLDVVEHVRPCLPSSAKFGVGRFGESGF